MDFSSPPILMRAFHGPVRRLLAGAVGAGLLLLAVPVPAVAAPTPSVTITDVTVTEGTGGTVNANFTIQAAPAPKPGAGLQVSWATASGSATAPADFTAASGAVSLTKTSASKVISVLVLGDALNEPNETFSVNLTNLVASSGRIGDAQGVATITDDDPVPVLSVNDASVTEGNAATRTATFMVTLSAASGKTVTFDWATTAGSASQGVDYVAAAENRAITAGSTGVTVDVTVKGDVLDESNETFGITLSNAVNATIGDGSGIGTITDDDPIPLLSVNDASVTEGDAGTKTATFTVTLSAASGQTVTVDWATASGTAGQPSDYVAGSGTGTFVPGDTSESIDVIVKGDVLDEADETFGITLSNAVHATIGDGSGTGTITDDDPIPLLSVTDASVTEGDIGSTTATFTVTLSAASGQTVTVDWATVDGTATQPSDYVSGSSTLTFPAGTTTRTIGVAVNGETVPELDETFRVTLSNATNAVIGDAVGIGTILDDELEAVIDIDDPTVIEHDTGTTTLTFGVTLSNPSVSTVTVDWATSDGTATAGSDYLGESGTVTFAPLATSETVQVTVYGDTTYELGETVTLDLSNPTNAPIGKAQAIGTISNDDPAPTVSVGDATVVEGNAGTSLLTFVVSLVGNSDLDASFDFATSDATATAGADYVAGSGTLTIPAGATTGTVDVIVDGDGTYESSETLSLTIGNPTGAAIGDGVAVGTITNDDKAPTSLTLQVVRKPRSVVAKGILEPATSGERVTVTLLRKQGGKFVKVTAKTVSVRYLKDRDGDGKTDGSYIATFTRPKTKGSYKVLTRFKGTANYKPRSLAKVFTLAAI
jgi:large repetitive protein